MFSGGTERKDWPDDWYSSVLQDKIYDSALIRENKGQ